MLNISIINPIDEITKFNRTIGEKEMFIAFAMAVAGKEAEQISFKTMDLVYNPKIRGFEQEESLWEKAKKIRSLGENPYEYLAKNVIGTYNPLTMEKGEFLTPFEIFRRFSETKTMDDELKRVKMGKYSLLHKGYTMLGNGELDLSGDPLAPEVYENLPGISFKSSRFFLLHTYKDVNTAVLDTHILKFLNEIGVKEAEGVKQTPGSKNTYLKIEKRFLESFEEFKNGTIGIKTGGKIEELLGPYFPTEKKDLSIADFDFAIWKYSKFGKKED